MGEEKKEEVEKKKKKEEEEAQEIVLKVDMHCEACARKVTRALKGFEGVEEVKVDCKASKVVVKGKDDDKKKEDDKKEEPKPAAAAAEEKKPQPPAVITVVLKVGMHCEACAQVLQKRIRKIQGVESVTTDIGNDQVIVKGVVDPEKLVNDVYKKTGKQASVVVKEEEKKEEKKEEEKKDEKQDDKKAAAPAAADESKEDGEKKTADIKKMEHWPQKYYMDYAYAPQMFSDENPNACSVM
ncbi:hypothetical protein ACS0TY_032155 [Phlomoides rotata]